MKLYKVEAIDRETREVIVYYHLKGKNSVFEFLDLAQVTGSVKVGEPHTVERVEDGLSRETIIRKALRNMNKARTPSAYFFNSEYTFWVQEVKEDNSRSGILWTPKEKED